MSTKLSFVFLVFALLVFGASAGINIYGAYHRSVPATEQPAPTKVSYEILHRDDFSKVVIAVNGRGRSETLTCFQYAESPCMVTKTGFGVFYQSEHLTIVDAPTNGEARCHIDQATVVGESAELCGFHVVIKGMK